MSVDTFTNSDSEAASTGAARIKARLNVYTILVALLASTNSMLLGYDIGVMSGAKLYIQEDLHISSKNIDILTGSLNVFSLIGSLAAGKTSDSIGRKYTVILAAMMFLVGALAMGLAPSFWLLMIGRAIAGVGVGYSLMVAPVYTAEISPASTRGLLGAVPEVFINVGILCGYVMNYLLQGLSPKINWRLMLGVAVIPAFSIVLGVLMMPESPRWLVMKGRNDEARRVLIKTSNGGEEEAIERLEEITSAAAAASVANDDHSNGPWRELILNPTKPIRRIVVAAIGINFFMQGAGNDAVVYYCPEVFKAAGIKTKKHLFVVNILMSVAKTAFAMISAAFLDSVGRRPLLMIGSSGMALSSAGLGVGSFFLHRSVEKPTWVIALCVLAVCADVSFFSIGLGPITWIYSSEIFPTRLRAQGTSIAISVNRLVSGLVTIGFPMVASKITFGGAFFVFAGVAGSGFIFICLFLPETKGRNLEDIEELFDSTHDRSHQNREMAER